jgi:predicted RecA/RadA family phage recombinase
MYTRQEVTTTVYDIAALLRCSVAECGTIRMTTPTTGNALPQSAASAVQQGFAMSGNRAPIVIVYSGTIVKTGDTYGVLYQDSELATTSAYITRAPRILFQIVAADAASITNGVDLYMVDATMRVTHDANGGANKWIGKCIGAVETDPLGLPAGKYVPTNFTQVAL